MYKMNIDVTPKGVKKAVDTLPLKQRIKLLEQMEEELFPKRFRKISLLLRSKAKTTSLNKITQIVRKVRKQLHGNEKT